MQLINHLSIGLSTGLSNGLFTYLFTPIMSDGNFNRQLLPKTELSSGIRAGKAQMRMKAEHAFDEVINTFLPDEETARKELMKQRFMELLR